MRVNTSRQKRPKGIHMQMSIMRRNQTGGRTINLPLFCIARGAPRRVKGAGNLGARLSGVCVWGEGGAQSVVDICIFHTRFSRGGKEWKQLLDGTVYPGAEEWSVGVRSWRDYLRGIFNIIVTASVVIIDWCISGLIFVFSGLKIHLYYSHVCGCYEKKIYWNEKENQNQSLQSNSFFRKFLFLSYPSACVCIHMYRDVYE